MPTIVGILTRMKMIIACVDLEMFSNGGPFLTKFFRGERIQIRFKPSHKRPASEISFIWCFASVDDGPPLNAGLP